MAPVLGPGPFRALGSGPLFWADCEYLGIALPLQWDWSRHRGSDPLKQRGSRCSNDYSNADGFR